MIWLIVNICCVWLWYLVRFCLFYLSLELKHRSGDPFSFFISYWYILVEQVQCGVRQSSRVFFVLSKQPSHIVFVFAMYSFVVFWFAASDFRKMHLRMHKHSTQKKQFSVLLRTYTNKRNQTYYSPAYEAGVLSIDYIGGWWRKQIYNKPRLKLKTK